MLCAFRRHVVTLISNPVHCKSTTAKKIKYRDLAALYSRELVFCLHFVSAKCKDIKRDPIYFEISDKKSEDN
jgi:hypothetical protein